PRAGAAGAERGGPTAGGRGAVLRDRGGGVPGADRAGGAVAGGPPDEPGGGRRLRGVLHAAAAGALGARAARKRAAGGVGGGVRGGPAGGVRLHSWESAVRGEAVPDGGAEGRPR